MVWSDYHAARNKATGVDHRHTRANTPATYLVRSRSYDPTVPSTSHHHSPSDEVGATTTFHLHEEGIHVEVRDPLGKIRHAPTVLARQRAFSIDLTALLKKLHLVRHGEVLNPDHVVYADLDGFGLSAIGHRQAASTAKRMARAPVYTVVSSPLTRALETAAAISHTVSVDVTIDERLTEWSLGSRWAGVRWDDIPTLFPGEIEAYLARPADLNFAPESIAEVAIRMESVVSDLGVAHPGGEAVIVSHQDPIQALRLAITGRKLAQLQTDKPKHACVITLAAQDTGWTEVTSWAPETKSAPFPPVDPPGTT